MKNRSILRLKVFHCPHLRTCHASLKSSDIRLASDMHISNNDVHGAQISSVASERTIHLYTRCFEEMKIESSQWRQNKMQFADPSDTLWGGPWVCAVQEPPWEQEPAAGGNGGVWCLLVWLAKAVQHLPRFAKISTWLVQWLSCSRAGEPNTNCEENQGAEQSWHCHPEGNEATHCLTRQGWDGWVPHVRPRSDRARLDLRNPPKCQARSQELKRLEDEHNKLSKEIFYWCFFLQFF